MTTSDTRKTMEAPIAVVGGGPSGIFQALYLAKYKKRKVTLIEQQPAMGGMIRSERTPWGPADQGAYLFQECGDAAFDALYYDVLPEDDWHILSGVRKDIGGNFFAGRLNEGALFPDIRLLPAADYARAITELHACAGQPLLRHDEAPHLRAFLEARFGPHIVRLIHERIAQKFWRQPLEALSPWAAKMVHMTRVVAYDTQETMRLKENAGLDQILASPDQLGFPPNRLSSPIRVLYPRHFGLDAVADRMTEALVRFGVDIRTSTKVTGLEQAAGRVNALLLQTANGTERLEVRDVLWTTGNAPLLPLLGAQPKSIPVAPLAHRVVCLFIDRPPLTGPLYWLWNYDANASWVRVSIPSAYCPDSAASGQYIMCVETNVADPTIADADIIAQVAAELRATALIPAEAKIIGGHALKAGRGYFVPSVSNVETMIAQANIIARAKPENLHVSGQDLTAGIFYLPDILAASGPIMDRL